MRQTKKVPFDSERAKNGAKIVTRCGYPVRIGLFDAKNERYPIIAAVEINGQEDPYRFTAEGNFHYANKEAEFDLFIEEEVKTRRMTNQELAWWLRDCPEEHREWRFDTCSSVYTSIDYSEEKEHNPVADDILIRRNGEEWQEPLIEE